MKHLNSLSITASLILVLTLQGCSKDEKSKEGAFQDNTTHPRKKPIQTRLSSLEAYKEEVKVIESLMAQDLTPDTVLVANQSGEKTHMLVLIKDKNQTPHHLFVWKSGKLDTLTEELDCRFKEGRLLMARHKDQEFYFEKGRMQFWLDEKGQSLPIMDTEEWLDQSNMLINLTEDYLRKFEK